MPLFSFASSNKIMFYSNREFHITRHVSFLVLVLAFAFSSFNDSFGQLVEERLIEQALTSSGRFASMEFVVAVDASHARPTVLLNFEKSGLINASRSKITLFVDDRPRKSLRIRDANRTIRLPLEERPGFQRISIRASLIVDNDSCLSSHPEGAWMTMLETSSYTYRKRRVPKTKQENLSISDLPVAWQPGSAVHVEYYGQQTKESVLSKIDWNHRFRSWNFVPSSRADTADYFVKIFESGHASIPDSLNLELTEHQDVQAVMRLNDTVLNVVVDKAQSASRASLMISDFRSRDLCTSTLCKLGPEFQAAELEIENTENDEWAAKLEQLGYPNGWTARGDGTSTLRLYWERPPWWELLRYPELRMQVRKSGTGDWREDMPALSVRINGQPIASFSLSSVKSNLANVTARIPAHFWDAAGWSIEIDAHLEQDNASCAFSESDHSWLVIEPGSGLFIPRKETEFNGISDLFINGKKPPSIKGELELLDQNVSLVSNLLYPFRSFVKESFDWPENCTIDCYQIVEAGQISSLEQLSLEDGMHSLDKDGDLRIPVLLTSTSTQIFRNDSDYIVGLPKQMPKSEILIPDYRALKSPFAIHYDDNWVAIESVDPNATQIQIGESLALAGVESDQGQKLKLIHLLIGLLLAVVLAVGAIWLWRGFRMYDREELDSKNIEHFS